MAFIPRNHFWPGSEELSDLDYYEEQYQRDSSNFDEMDDRSKDSFGISETELSRELARLQDVFDQIKGSDIPKEKKDELLSLYWGLMGWTERLNEL